MANREQDEREIKDGHTEVDLRSVRPLREFAIAFMNGQEIPAQTKARLSELNDQAFALRGRSADLNRKPRPERQPWMDPASEQQKPAADK